MIGRIRLSGLGLLVAMGGLRSDKARVVLSAIVLGSSGA